MGTVLFKLSDMIVLQGYIIMSSHIVTLMSSILSCPLSVPFLSPCHLLSAALLCSVLSVLEGRGESEEGGERRER